MTSFQIPQIFFRRIFKSSSPFPLRIPCLDGILGITFYGFPPVYKHYMLGYISMTATKYSEMGYPTSYIQHLESIEKQDEITSKGTSL